jgi:hypothetical protein
MHLNQNNTPSHIRSASRGLIAVTISVLSFAASSEAKSLHKTFIPQCINQVADIADHPSMLAFLGNPLEGISSLNGEWTAEAMGRIHKIQFRVNDGELQASYDGSHFDSLLVCTTINKGELSFTPMVDPKTANGTSSVFNVIVKKATAGLNRIVMKSKASLQELTLQKTDSAISSAARTRASARMPASDGT